MHVCLLNSCFCVAACLSRVRGYYTCTCFLEFLSVCHICRFRATNEAGAVGVNWLSICLARGLCFRSETSVNCSFGQAFSLANLKKVTLPLSPAEGFLSSILMWHHCLQIIPQEKDKPALKTLS